MIEINQKFDIALDKKMEKISTKVKNHFPYYMEKISHLICLHPMSYFE